MIRTLHRRPRHPLCHPSASALLAAALLLAVALLLACGGDEDASDALASTDEAVESSQRTDGLSTSAGPSPSPTTTLKCSLYFNLDDLYEAPSDDWHPRDDEGDEWMLGWWMLPHPYFEPDTGRVVSQHCNDDSSLLERCFGLCVPLRAPREGAYPCNECFEAFGFSFEVVRVPRVYNLHSHPALLRCGFSYKTFRCSGEPGEQIWREHEPDFDYCGYPKWLPRERHSGSYIELDGSEVAACWYRPPEVRNLGIERPYPPHTDYVEYMQNEWWPALQRALEAEGADDSDGL